MTNSTLVPVGSKEKGRERGREGKRDGGGNG
jgi:hypothetical protein